MAKANGLGDNLYVGGYDLSGDTGEIQRIAQPRTLLDVTGIDKSAHERIYGLRDGAIEFRSFFNDENAYPFGSFEALNGLPTADVTASYFRGTTLGGRVASLVAKQVNYDPTRGADGSFIFDTQLLANGYGLEWGQSLTAGKRTDTTATAPATGADFTDVTTSFGMAAYLHVFTVTGTSVTCTIQDSADNSSFAAITGLSSFAAATPAASPQTQRIETDTLVRDVRRYLKVNTTGTFTEAIFAVSVVRYHGADRAL